MVSPDILTVPLSLPICLTLLTSSTVEKTPDVEVAATLWPGAMALKMPMHCTRSPGFTCSGGREAGGSLEGEGGGGVVVV